MKFKNIFALIIGLLMVGATVFAAYAEPTIEVKQSNWFTNLFDQGLYISGGTIETNNIYKGDSVDAKTTLRYRLAGDRTKLRLSWYNENDKEYSYITSKEYNYDSKVGSYIKVSAKNLDTSKLSDDWCGDYIKLSGIHEVRVNGVWKVDTKSLSALGTKDTTKNTISENFVLKCDSPCTKEDKEPYCSSNRVYQKVVNSESCAYESKKLDTCKSDEKCENAKCIPDEVAKVCNDFEYGCSGTKVIAICTTDNSDFNINKDCASNGLVCEQGECVSNQPIVKEKLLYILVDGECKEISMPSNEPTTDDMYESVSSCEAEIVKEGGVVPVIGVPEKTWNEEIFDFKDNTAMAVSTTAMLIIISLLLIYLLVPKKVWNKLL